MLWKWSIVATIVVLGCFLWQCGSALMTGRELSNAAAQRFHGELNSEQYEQIYDEADAGFRSSGKKEELVKFLQAVHRKLGNAGTQTLSNIMVQSTPGGTFLIATYTTKFDRGAAVEKFVWIKESGRLVLRGYNVQSNTFIVD